MAVANSPSACINCSACLSGGQCGRINSPIAGISGRSERPLSGEYEMRSWGWSFRRQYSEKKDKQRQVLLERRMLSVRKAIQRALDEGKSEIDEIEDIP